jgi:Zn-finger nucleic acid-binding protein
MSDRMSRLHSRLFKDSTMPLLMCPNDDTAMQTVDRAGVQFDMCPTCRGVWLDRGELEKLMAAGAAAPAPAPTGQPWGQGAPTQGQPPRRDAYGKDEYRGDDQRRGDYRRKRPSIFDIFDD